jgi:hypothetical protein
MQLQRLDDHLVLRQLRQLALRGAALDHRRKRCARHTTTLRKARRSLKDLVIHSATLDLFKRLIVLLRNVIARSGMLRIIDAPHKRKAPYDNRTQTYHQPKSQQSSSTLNSKI